MAAGGGAAPSHDPIHEVRFAVVIYGGVSLAIYINGIVQEMLRMVRATAPATPGGAVPLLDRPSGSEAVYRVLGQILADPSRAPHEIYEGIRNGAVEPIRCRLTIDVLSGTSAGGINAMFLAKALANNQDLNRLQQLWIDEGDIEPLLNDRESLAPRLSPQKPPQSLLNSRRMYLKLLDALDAMDKEASSDAPSPLVDRLDLFSTATDIAGLSLPLALSDSVVEERRHRNVFHFQHPSADPVDRSDFKVDDNPFLAYAARCTSAFPFAFEPMALCDIFPIVQTAAAHRHKDYCDPDTRVWQRYYMEYIGSENPDRFNIPFSQRAFGDGGYLDNKPFSHAVDAVFRRHAELPVTRKLVYVEPSPERLRAPRTSARPDALENSIAALVSLPRYETVREDLERVIARNAHVERVRRVIRDLEVENALDAPASGGDPQSWLQQSAGDMRKFGGGYSAYEKLKLSAVTDELVELVCTAFQIDVKSGYADAMRALARVWRVSRYPRLVEQRQFLMDFDVSYRVRRLRYVRRHIDDACRNPADEGVAYYEELKRIKAKMKEPLDLLHALLERRRQPEEFFKPQQARPDSQLFTPAEMRLVIEPPRSLDEWKGLENYPLALQASQQGREARAEYVIHVLGGLDRITNIAQVLKGEFEPVFRRASADAIAACKDDPSLSPVAKDARGKLRRLYDRFEAYDSVLFPIIFGTDLGEGGPIDIHRISPDDARALEPEVPLAGPKVKGQAFGAFGAFLDRSWRQNDILWGRLDGAERLISILLPGRDDATAALRKHLIERAHGEIVTEVLKAPADKSWRDELRNYIAGKVRTEAEPRLMVRSAARATAISGELLEDIAETRRITRRPFAQAALFGRLAWGLVEVSIPRTVYEILFTYWLYMLLAAATLATVLALFFQKFEVARLAGTVVVVLIVVYFARVLLRRYLRGVRVISPAALSAAAVAAAFALAFLFSRIRLRVPDWQPLAATVRDALAGAGAGELASGMLSVWSGHLAQAAIVMTVVTGYFAMKSARAVEPPPGGPTRAVLALELASTWGTVRAVLGPRGHYAREQLRRSLTADYPFIAAYTLLFVSLGLLFGSMGYRGGWVLVALGLVAGLTDIGENQAMGRLLHVPLPDPFDPQHKLEHSPRLYALVKWGCVAASVILTAVLTTLWFLT